MQLESTVGRESAQRKFDDSSNDSDPDAHRSRLLVASSAVACFRYV